MHSYSNAENGTWNLRNIPTGKHELLLDADNDLPSNQYLVAQRQKDWTVELTDGQGFEVNLQVKCIA